MTRRRRWFPVAWRCNHCAGPLVIEHVDGELAAVCVDECEGYRGVGAGVDRKDLDSYIKHERGFLSLG